MRPHATRDLPRITLAVLCLAALIGASLWVMRPFLGPTIWATMVVVATWPMMLRLQSLLGGRRLLAVTAMTLLLLLLFVVPLLLAIATIVEHADRLVEWAKLAATYEIPDQAPAWLAELPMVGGTLAGLWEQAAAAGLKGLMGRLSPYAGQLTRWFVGQVGGLGMLLLQFLITVIVAALMYGHGEEAASLARRFVGRIAGQRGREAVQLAGDAIRGVALGVGITAVVQSVVTGVALAIAGIPFAGLLTALTFMLSIAQIGPAPVLVPAAIWLFWNEQIVAGVFIVIVLVVVTSLDNVLRPILIRMGAELPLLLIFAGVIGGLVAFGLVGIFVGPVVLAVAWTLLEAWMSDGENPPPPQGHSDAG